MASFGAFDAKVRFQLIGCERGCDGIVQLAYKPLTVHGMTLAAFVFIDGVQVGDGDNYGDGDGSVDRATGCHRSPVVIAKRSARVRLLGGTRMGVHLKPCGRVDGQIAEQDILLQELRRGLCAWRRWSWVATSTLATDRARIWVGVRVLWVYWSFRRGTVAMIRIWVQMSLAWLQQFIKVV